MKITLKEQLENEKRRNKYLSIVTIILCVVILFAGIRYNIVLEEKENICYVSNSMVDYINKLQELAPLDLERMDYLKCDCGNAGERLNE